MGCIQTTCNPKLKGMKIRINNNIREQKKSLCDISGLDLTRPNQIQISNNKNNNNKSNSNIFEFNNNDEQSPYEERIIILKPMSQSTKISVWKTLVIEQKPKIKQVQSCKNLYNEKCMKRLMKKCLCSDHSVLIPANTIKNKDHKSMILLGKFDAKKENDNKTNVNINI
jgi:hypothetical protein